MDLLYKSSKTNRYIMNIWVYFGIIYTMKQFIVIAINYYAGRILHLLTESSILVSLSNN